MFFSYLVVLFYCHFIWFYLTRLNLINGDGDGERVRSRELLRFITRNTIRLVSAR